MPEVREVARLTINQKTAEDAILRYLQNNQMKPIAVSLIAHNAGVPLGSAAGHIARMINRGKLSRHELRGGYGYTINGEVEVSAPAPAPAPAGTTSRRELVYNSVERHNGQPLSYTNIVEETHLAYSQVVQVVTWLVDRGHIQRVEVPHPGWGQPKYAYRTLKPLSNQPRQRQYRVMSSDQMDKVREDIMVYITPRQGRVLKTEQIARNIGVPTWTTNQHIHRLMEDGYLYSPTKKYRRFTVLKPYGVEEVPEAAAEVVQEVDSPEAVSTPIMEQPQKKQPVTAFKTILQEFAFKKGPEYKESAGFALRVLNDLADYAYAKYEDAKSENEEPDKTEEK
jgi:predicted transcriptional regulator